MGGDSKQLKGRIALITGAGKGLGKSMALALAEAGVDLALTGRNVDGLKEVASLAQKQGVRPEVFKSDVTLEKDVVELERAVAKAFGKIDILINNAGINVRKKVTEFTYEEWTSVINTN